MGMYAGIPTGLYGHFGHKSGILATNRVFWPQIGHLVRVLVLSDVLTWFSDISDVLT